MQGKRTNPNTSDLTTLEEEWMEPPWFDCTPPWGCASGVAKDRPKKKEMENLDSPADVGLLNIPPYPKDWVDRRCRA